MKKFIYLAIPYTYNAAESFSVANVVAASLMQQGYAVFSPISHSHVIAEYLPAHKFDFDFWTAQDLPILKQCDELWLVNVDPEHGHTLIETSRGCQFEIAVAHELCKPIKYYNLWEHPAECALTMVK